MLEHFNETQHPICFSFADFSYWCYECESYVVHVLLDHADIYYKEKFGQERDNAKVLEIIKQSKHANQVPIEERDKTEDE